MLVGEVNVASSVIYLSVHFPSGEKAGKKFPPSNITKVYRRILTRLCQAQDARMTTGSPSSQQLFHFLQSGQKFSSVMLPHLRKF